MTSQKSFFCFNDQTHGFRKLPFISALLFILFFTFSISFSQSNKIPVIPFKQANNSECEPHSLIIHTIPEGAEIHIDSVFYGLSPIEIKDINVLHVDIVLIKDTIKQKHNIYNFHKTNELFFMLDTSYGLLNILTKPDSATVFINDSLIGITPLIDFKLKTGIIKLKLKKEDYEDIENFFTIKSLRYNLNYSLFCKFGYLSLGNIESDKIKIDSREYVNHNSLNFKLPVGYHNFEAFPPDFHRPVKNELFIQSEKNYSLNFEYNYFTLEYFSKSLIIPGLGQFLDGSKIKGASFLAASIISSALLWKSYINYHDKAEDVKNLRNLYLVANNEADALKYRTLLKSSDTELTNLKNTKNLLLGTFIGIYISNLMDTFIFHTNGGSFTLEKRNPTSTTLIDTFNFNFSF